MDKLVLKGETSFSRKPATERLEPMLGYCSGILSHLNKEDSSRLSDNLLEILDDLRPCLRVNKKISPLIFELIDWSEVKNKEERNEEAFSSELRK